MLQKYIISKQKTLKWKIMHSVLVIFQKNLQSIIKNRIKTVKFFHVDFNSIDTNDILDTHKYLMNGK